MLARGLLNSGGDFPKRKHSVDTKSVRLEVLCKTKKSYDIENIHFRIVSALVFDSQNQGVKAMERFMMSLFIRKVTFLR